MHQEIKNKKNLLAIFITAAMSQSATAASFSSNDARSMAMGGTGVSSARIGHASKYNPALLSTAKEDEDFSIVLPQVGVFLSDSDDFIDSAKDFEDADYVNIFEDNISTITDSVDTITNSYSTIDNAIRSNDLNALVVANATLANDVNALTQETVNLQEATIDLNKGLKSLSGKNISGGLNFSGGIAIPSKTFASAISLSSESNVSGILSISEEDLNKLTNYTNATNAYALKLDDYAKASNEATLALQAIDNIGGMGNASAEQISALNNASTDLDNANHALNTFSYGGDNTLEDDGDEEIFINGSINPDAEDITLESTARIVGVAISELAFSFSHEFNIYGEDIAIGITPKMQRVDIFDYTVSVDDEIDLDDADDFKTDDTAFNFDIGAAKSFGDQDQLKVGLVVKNIISRKVESIAGHVVKIEPQVRVGTSYSWNNWVNVAADLDLTENAPIGFGSSTQYLALGTELDVFNLMQLRVGYRSNLATHGEDIVSAGLGLSPFGVNMDIGVYANTDNIEKEAGIILETGFSF